MQPGSTSRSRPFDVVFNLSAHGEGLFLPLAFVVSRDQEGYLAHIQQRAMPSTIGAFGLEMDEVLARLFELTDQLQPRALEEHFRQPRRKALSLEDLLGQEETKTAVFNYVHRRLDEMLRLIVRHDLPLAWDAERKALVKDFVMEKMRQELEPELAFKKTDKGVIYRLLLREGRKVWKISSREVIPIVNHPAWVFADFRLYRIAHINGNMVKPFRQRDLVDIPQSSVNAYFRKFILKVASRVDIEAIGFEVAHFDRLEACRLEPVRNLFSGEWVLSVQMAYHQAQFNWSDRKDRRTTMEIGEGEQVRILQVRRDRAAEAIFMAQLRRHGFENHEGSYFQIRDQTVDPALLLHWLGKHRAALEDLGFTIVHPEVEGRTLYLHQPELTISVQPENDWFDIRGEVQIGAFSIPFLRIAKYIREDNPYFPLPDGAYFLIPREWFHRYRELAGFARAEGEHLRLAKSQYTLLEALDISAGVTVDLGPVDYQPSPLLKASLRPYQQEGVRWLVQLYRQGLGACLADDMGLGKTLQTIAVLLHAKEHKIPQAEQTSHGDPQLNLFKPAADQEFLRPLNALIVLPASLVFNWENELRRFAPSLSICNHTGPKRPTDPRLLARFDVILTTYQTTLRDAGLLAQIEFEYIILDESQQIKNRESKVFQTVSQLNGKHRISLSGTPIENSLSDLWSQMQFINPDLLGSFAFFKKEYITPIEKGQDEEKKKSLRTLVKPYLLRRTKEEVAKDLPPLTTKVFYTEMTPEQKKLYEREKSAARNFLLENFQANSPQYRILVLQSLTRLRQLVNHPTLVRPDYDQGSGKFNDVLEHFEVIRKSGHKTLFFSSFVQYLELFRAHFEEQQLAFSWLTGALDQKSRKAQIERFEKDPAVQSFLISIKSGGTGLNLTAADYVFILDPWWNPTTEQQAIARAHRIGQDKHVIAVKFITRESIEEKILKLQDRKAQLAEDIIGNIGKLDFSRGDLEFLLA